MAFANTGALQTFTAGADLSSSRYRFVEIGSADHTIIAATDDAGPILGVVDYPNGSGEQVGVQIHGIAKVEASAAISRGVQVSATTGGKAVTANITDGTVVGYIGGIALEAAGADGDIISVLLTPGAAIRNN